jgi:FKBP-type peptidyl-prolyl cis-trans isomerase
MRSFPFFVATGIALAISFSAGAQDGLPQPGATVPTAPTGPAGAAPSEYRQQVGYMLGQNIGQDLRENQIECDLQSLFAGISDALRGAAPKWSDAELQACAQQFEQEMRAKAAAQAQQNQQVGQQNARQAAEFLAANRQREGVQATASGLQYKVLKQGDGPSPTRADSVRCHYRGTLLDGTEFDSSLGGEPAEFPVGGVIAGWTEALQKMHVGDRWQLFIPPDLAYGPEQRGPIITPNSLLVFEIELLGIVE